MHKFLQSTHQHYKIADPRSLISQSISVLNNAKYRFTKYSSLTGVNTVSICFNRLDFSSDVSEVRNGKFGKHKRVV